MSFDAVFKGTPDSVNQPSGTARIGVDTATNQLYVQSPDSDGWQPNAGAAAGTGIEINGTPVTSPNAIFNDGDTVTFTGPDEDGNIFAHTVGVVPVTTTITTMNAGSNVNGVFNEGSGLETAVRIGLYVGYDVATGSAAVGTLTWTQNGKSKSLVVMTGTGTDDTFALSAVVTLLVDGSTSVTWTQASDTGTGTAYFTSEVLKTFVN